MDCSRSSNLAGLGRMHTYVLVMMDGEYLDGLVVNRGEEEVVS